MKSSDEKLYRNLIIGFCLFFGTFGAIGLARFVGENLFSGQHMAGEGVVSVMNVEQVKNYDLTAVVTDDEAANADCASDDVCVNLDTDTITFDAAHNYADAIKVEFSSSGTLPSPLMAATPYYLKVVTGNSVRVYATAADALAGTNPIDLTAITEGSGGGYPGFSAETDALDAGMRLQRNDAPEGETPIWVDVDVNQDVSAGGTFNWEGTTAARQLRLYYDGQGGQATVTARFSGKD